ncbi:uncharacterized protein RB166_019868 [Leptodactylus fuscus]
MERSIIVCLLIWVIGVHCASIPVPAIVTPTGDGNVKIVIDLSAVVPADAAVTLTSKDGKCKAEMTPNTPGNPMTMTFTAAEQPNLPSPGAATITLSTILTALENGVCKRVFEIPTGFVLQDGYAAMGCLVKKFIPDNFFFEYPCPNNAK